MIARVRALISGRVQGVFYRESLRRQAQARGVAGWVRNLPDGRVEAVLEGPEGDVADVLAFARRGPPFASVRDLETERLEPVGAAGPFEVR